jgi:hypothetical protein
MMYLSLSEHDHTSPSQSRIKKPQLPDDELGRTYVSQLSFRKPGGGLLHFSFRRGILLTVTAPHPKFLRFRQQPFARMLACWACGPAQATGHSSLLLFIPKKQKCHLLSPTIAAGYTAASCLRSHSTAASCPRERSIGASCLRGRFNAASYPRGQLHRGIRPPWLLHSALHSPATARAKEW